MSSVKKSIRLKKTSIRQPSPEPPQPKSPKKIPVTNSKRMKEYRLLLKADPEKYTAHLEANRQRCQAYRTNLTEDDRKRNAELSRERMRRSRERKREKLLALRMETMKDIKAVEEQRRKWNEEYRKRSQKMLWKTRDDINARRRKMYQQKKLAEKIRILESTTKEVQCNDAEYLAISTIDLETELVDRTPFAKRKAFRHAKAGCYPIMNPNFENNFKLRPLNNIPDIAVKEMLVIEDEMVKPTSDAETSIIVEIPANSQIHCICCKEHPKFSCGFASNPKHSDQQDAVSDSSFENNYNSLKPHDILPDNCSSDDIAIKEELLITEDTWTGLTSDTELSSTEVLPVETSFHCACCKAQASFSHSMTSEQGCLTHSPSQNESVVIVSPQKDSTLDNHVSIEKDSPLEITSIWQNQHINGKQVVSEPKQCRLTNQVLVAQIDQILSEETAEDYISNHSNGCIVSGQKQTRKKVLCNAEKRKDGISTVTVRPVGQLTKKRRIDTTLSLATSPPKQGALAEVALAEQELCTEPTVHNRIHTYSASDEAKLKDQSQPNTCYNRILNESISAEAKCEKRLQPNAGQNRIHSDSISAEVKLEEQLQPYTGHNRNHTDGTSDEMRNKEQSQSNTGHNRIHTDSTSYQGKHKELLQPNMSLHEVTKILKASSKSQSLYLVVRFIDTNEVEVIPFNWLDQKHANCALWPDNIRNIQRAVVQMIQPRHTWKSFPIKELFRTDSYIKAVTKLENGEICSDLYQNSDICKTFDYRQSRQLQISPPNSTMSESESPWLPSHYPTLTTLTPSPNSPASSENSSLPQPSAFPRKSLLPQPSAFPRNSLLLQPSAFPRNSLLPQPSASPRNSLLPQFLATSESSSLPQPSAFPRNSLLPQFLASSEDAQNVCNDTSPKNSRETLSAFEVKILTALEELRTQQNAIMESITVILKKVNSLVREEDAIEFPLPDDVTLPLSSMDDRLERHLSSPDVEKKLRQSEKTLQ